MAGIPEPLGLRDNRRMGRRWLLNYTRGFFSLFIFFSLFDRLRLLSSFNHVDGSTDVCNKGRAMLAINLSLKKLFKTSNIKFTKTGSSLLYCKFARIKHYFSNTCADTINKLPR